MAISPRAASVTAASLLGLALVVAACTERSDPLLPPGEGPGVTPQTPDLARLQCRADAVARTVACAPMEPAGTGASRSITPTYGGQGVYVQLTSSNIAVAADTFSFDVTLGNLLPQAIGTADGTTPDGDGTRVFFLSEPATVGAGGPVEVVPDDFGTFTQSGQPYYQYDGVIEAGATSAAERFALVLNGAEGFTFQLAIRTTVRWPYLATITTPVPSEPLDVGATLDVDANYRRYNGDVLAVDSAVEFVSLDPAVATVDAATGLVTAVAAGSTQIVAQGIGAEAANVRPDTLPIVVNNAPQAVLDSVDVIGNLSARGAFSRRLLANDDDLNSGNGSLFVHPADRTRTTLAGGTLELDSLGVFAYHPPAGYSGRDSVFYRVTDGVEVDSALVIFRISPVNLWFVDGDAGPAGDGTQNAPFQTLAAADAPSQAGDTIIVVGSAAAAAGGITLDDGQAVLGAAHPTAITYALNDTTLTALEVAAEPSRVHLATAGTAVTLGQNNTIIGVRISAGSGTAVSGSGFGTVRIANASLVAAGGAALSLSGGAADIAVDSLAVSASSGAGVSLTNVTGTITALRGAIEGAAASSPGLLVSGGSVSFDHGGRIEKSTSGAAVSVAGGHTGTIGVDSIVAGGSATGLSFDNADGTYAFAPHGSLTGPGGIAVANGSDGVFTFAAGYAITNASGVGVSVSGGTPALVYAGSIASAGTGRPASIGSLTADSVVVSGAVTSSGLGLLVQDNTGGLIAFTGSPKTLGTGAAPAVSLANNTGATVRFAGGDLALTTTSATAFSATGGGTVEVTGSNNTAASSGGAPVSINGVTIGSTSGVTFRSVSGPGGLQLVNTGAGTFQVTGDGSTAGSGGTLGTLGAGTGVTLTNTTTTTLNHVDIAAQTGISGTDFGTLSVTGSTVNAQNGPALALSNGTVNGTFPTVSSTSSVATNGLSLANLGGTFTIAGGSLAGGNAATVAVAGGTAEVTIAASVSQATANPLLSVSGGHTGTLAFSGTVSAGNGRGLQFDNADGTYQFTGTTNLTAGGAGIDIVNGSGGSFTFGTGTSISSALALDSAFVVNGSAPTVTYSGGIAKTGTGPAVAIVDQSGGTITFQTGLISANAGTGVVLSNADGTVNFNGTTTLNGGGAGVDIVNGSSGTFAFGTGASIASVVAADSAFTVNGSAPNVTYSGSITKSGGGLAVAVTNQTGGTITFQTGTVSATAGEGIALNNADGTVNFNGTTTLNGGDAAVDVTNGSGGTISFASGTTVTNPTNEAIRVINSAPTFSYAGSFTKNNNSVTGVLVQNNTGGTISFTGSTKTLSTGTANAVNLLSNGSATITFAGGNLALTTSSGTGFNATGGGTVVVTGANNTVNATSGTGVNVQNTTLGASGVTFRSVSAAGGANGIVLVSTGSNAFQVTGDGATAGSGGTIANTSGADGAVAGNGVYLSSAQNVRLARMQLNDHPNHAIRGTSVTTFTLDSSVVNGTNGNSLDGGLSEGAIRFDQLAGEVILRQNTISGGFLDNVYVANTSGSPSLNRLRLINNTLGGTINQDGVRLNATVGTFNVTATGNNFTYWEGDAFDMLAQGTATGDLVFQNNTVHNGNASPVSGSTNIAVGGGSFTYNISNNSFRGAAGAAIAVDESGSLTGAVSGTIANNQIGASGVTNSGSTQGSGIFVQQLGAGTSTTRIAGNTIRQINGSQAILVQVSDASGGGGNGTLNATVVGNDIREEGSTALAGRLAINLNIGTVSGDAHSACLQIGGSGADENVITSFGLNRIRPQHRFNTTVRMPGYAGGQYTTADVVSYLTGRNDAGGTPTINATTSSAGGGYQNTAGGANCPQPTT